MVTSYVTRKRKTSLWHGKAEADGAYVLSATEGGRYLREVYVPDEEGDGVLVVTPYYNKPAQEGLFRHYEFLAKKVDIPIVLYNVPGRTGVSIQPETVARLAQIPNVIGIKEASRDRRRTRTKNQEREA